MPRSEHFLFETVAEGVRAALARPGGGALANSGLLDLDGEVLVFDTSLNPEAAADLARETHTVFGRAPSLAANSHWHLDHILGNQRFADLPIYATRRTREILLTDADRLLAELTPAAIETDIAKIEGWFRAAKSVESRRELESVLQVNRRLLRVAEGLRMTPPDRTFEDRLRLPGARRAELLSFGSGHTASDALLHLPEDGVLCAGDVIVVNQHPNLISGDPEHWLFVLDEIDRLKVELVIPGHGPVSSGAGVAAMRDYVSTVLDLAESERESELPARFRTWEGVGQFEENMKFLKGRCARARDAAPTEERH